MTLRRKAIYGHRRLVMVGAGAGVLAISGCSASIHLGGTPSISKSSLESKITSSLKSNGVTATVSCSGGLTAKVGSTQQCTVKGNNGNTINGTAKVTSVSGHTANFSFDVAGNSGSSGQSVSNSGTADSGSTGSTGNS